MDHPAADAKGPLDAQNAEGRTEAKAEGVKGCLGQGHPEKSLQIRTGSVLIHSSLTTLSDFLQWDEEVLDSEHNLHLELVWRS